MPTLCLVMCIAPAAARTVAADTLPSPAPSPSPPAPAAGPCEVPTLPSLVDRPAIGRAPATSGAVCVAPPGAVILEVGYRGQTTTSTASQRLETYPAPVALIGIARGTELILAPGLAFSRRSYASGAALGQAAGQQDAGVGAQYVLSDKPAVQQALALLGTFPTGYPAGPSGYSAGVPTYSLFYAVAFSFGGKLGLSASQGLLVSAGPNASGTIQRFLAYQPNVTLSYAMTTSLTLLLEDQITAPTGPQAPTGNRALVGLQQMLSANVLIDVEYEVNALPSPGSRQHAFAAGASIRL